MIRFSAGLVVVAIGVLIGGVATSKLSLVYAAIAVSAVALVVLAIGVALKRDELFGGAPETASEGAGSGALATVATEAGRLANLVHGRDSDGPAGEGHDPAPRRAPGPATAAFEAAEAASAARAAAAKAAPAVAAPSMTSASAGAPVGNPPLEQRRPAFGQAQSAVADTVADWQQARSPQPAWAAVQQPGESRPTWTPREQPPPSAAKAGSGAAAPASASAAAPPAAAAPPVPPAPAPSAPPAPPAPGWFDKAGRPAEATVIRPVGGGNGSITEEPPTVARPTIKPSPDESPADETSHEKTSQDKTSNDEPSDPVRADNVTTDNVSPDSVSADADLDDEDWPTRYSWLEDDEPGDAEAVAGTTGDASLDQADAIAPADAAPADAAQPSYAEADSAAETADDADDVDAKDGPEDQPTLVTVIPGVPRYHDPDCILIRFMDEADVARKSIPEAEADNCTPCAACQPTG